MKIELDRNKVLFHNGSSIQEIHPFWLRERVDGEEYLDRGTQQRLFDPSSMSADVSIQKANINEGFLEVEFNDGVNLKLEIDKISSELSNKDTVIKSIIFCRAVVGESLYPPIINPRVPRPVFDPDPPPKGSVSSASISTQPIVSPL